MDIRNLEFLRTLPGFGPRLYEALTDIGGQQDTIAQQTNSNATGEPLPPPAIDSLTVTGQNGHFHAQIKHGAEFFRGLEYHLEFADNQGFQNPRAVALGPAREWHDFLGNGTYYFRASAAYSSSPSGPWAYHGGARSPLPVSGGGSIGGPAFLPPQGSGTGIAGEGLSGPGPVPFRSSTGRPPIRGESPMSGGSSGGSLAPGPSTGLPIPPSGGGGGGGGGSGSQFRYFTVVQSGLAGLATAQGLGAGDANQVQAYVTDYDHLFRWTGSAWAMMLDRAGYIIWTEVDPNPTTGWHLVDGSTVSYMNPDGTLTTGYVLENMTGSPGVMKTGASNSGLNAATAPGISGSTAGGTTNSNTTSISATTSATGTTQAETATGPSTVPTAGHVHAVNITDPGHTHSIPGLGVGTLAVDATGMPANWVRRPWFRL